MHIKTASHVWFVKDAYYESKKPYKFTTNLSITRNVVLYWEFYDWLFVLF